MKNTYFCVALITTIASFLGMFTIVANFNLEEGNISANAAAILSTTDSSMQSETDSSLPLDAKKDSLIKPNDPFFDKQWALSNLNLSAWWKMTAGNSDVVVAILDTGIDAAHEDLRDRVIAEVNFTNSPSANDINGHGTHVAGIICAASNNGVGVTGLVPDCKILNVKVADDYGFCQENTVARGIAWAVDNGADVINISLEIRNPSDSLEQAVNYAWQHGVLIIAAAGNQGNQSAVYPAFYENCIAVAAVRPDNTLAPLSNYGDWVDIVAPGFNIYSTLPGNNYGYETGTSFATAYVSAFAAMLSRTICDVNGDGKSNDEIRSVIEKSCSQVNYAGYTLRIINLTACIQ
jgi:thermitase